MIIFIPEKVHFQKKNVTKHKEDYFIMEKMLIHQGNIAIINLYMPNSRTSEYMKLNLIEV